MKITLDKKILAGIVICTAILLAVAFISFKNSEKFKETSQSVNHTHEVLYEFEQVLVTCVNAETGERGYIITGDEGYLEPFNNSESKIFEHLDKVSELTKDNLLQQKNIKEIRRQADLLTNRFEEVLARNFNLVFIVLLLVIGIVLVAVYIIITANLKALRSAQTATADKNWILEGSSDLTKGMQGNKRVTEITQTIINYLTTYLNAQTGTLYIAEQDNMHLRLVSAYAMDKRNKNFPVIRFGEGLAGQAAAEKRSILYTDISAGYFKVNTSFGEVVPKNIIAVPFVFENKVIGVIELGSIYDFTKLQKEYLSIAADSIAIAIASSQAREITKELLEETQLQAEELETQQEELKQTNEELHSKTELLEKSEQELKAQQEELQQTNEELEEKASLLEEQKEKLEVAKTDVEIKAAELEQTSKYKSEFLANMSHELRTPLNSILILAQLLSENKSKLLGEKEVKNAHSIFSSGTDLLNLINDILDLSKVEAGKIELEIGQADIDTVADDLHAMFSEIANNKSIDFKIIYQKENFKHSLFTDKQRLEQILRNLLSNAFKFTGKGGKVTLDIELTQNDYLFRNDKLSRLDQVVAFSVADTGIGVPENKQALIFQAFQQADGSTKRKYGGTGLGLSISKELAHALGGEIQLQSEEGKGSKFTLYLPLQFDPSIITMTDKEIEIKQVDDNKFKQVFEKNLITPEAHEALPGFQENITDDRYGINENDKVILIIEDDVRFAEVLRDFFREKNYKGIITRQGNTGLSMARYYRPDAIILDMKLPGMDGAAILKRLKNDPELRHIPVQIFSGYDRRKEGLELGAFDFIKKPVNKTDIHAAFDRMEEFIRKKIKKLLIVEDNREQNKTIRELIGNGDVKSFSAYGGAEAYEMLQKERFDCIIIDLGLPDMNGVDFLEKIKANDDLAKIPVIVYTGKDLDKEEASRLNKLADTVVLKTANSKERLLDETTLFLHRVESALPKEKQQIIRKLHRTDEVLKNKKVLLVDDDMRNIYSLTNALEEEGLKCITAENGKEAINILKEHSDIDIVLMDLMMPEMDGFEATREIRKMDKLEKLPVIALTAKAMKGDREKCLEAGMSDYISKPVNVAQLVSLMRVWLYR